MWFLFQQESWIDCFIKLPLASDMIGYKETLIFQIIFEVFRFILIILIWMRFKNCVIDGGQKPLKNIIWGHKKSWW